MRDFGLNYFGLSPRAHALAYVTQRSLVSLSFAPHHATIQAYLTLLERPSIRDAGGEDSMIPLFAATAYGSKFYHYHSRHDVLKHHTAPFDSGPEGMLSTLAIDVLTPSAIARAFETTFSALLNTTAFAMVRAGQVGDPTAPAGAAKIRAAAMANFLNQVFLNRTATQPTTHHELAASVSAPAYLQLGIFDSPQNAAKRTITENIAVALWEDPEQALPFGFLYVCTNK